MTTAASALIEIEPERRGVIQAHAGDQNTDPFIRMIERVVLDPNASVEKLERMLALREKAEDRARQHAKEDAASAAMTAYFAAMSACQQELPVVTKNKNNTHTRSTYADLAAIEEQAMPIIHKHGFGVVFQPAGYNEAGELLIKWRITHSQGHSESDIAGIPVDGAGSKGNVNKTGTQAFGSTATYGRRYLLCMLFNISTGDDRDGNKVEAPPEFITEEQVMNLRDLLTAKDADEAKFLNYIDATSLDQIYAKNFDHVVGVIKSKGSQS